MTYQNVINFLEKIIIPEDPNSCWKWTGTKHRQGYGFISIEGKMIKAHRVSYMYFNNFVLTRGMCVLHKCDNPECTNPGHLFLGTQADNIRDMVSKKRDVNSKKTHCPQGHPYSGENLKIFRGNRQCLTCRRKNDLYRYYKRRSKMSATHSVRKEVACEKN